MKTQRSAIEKPATIREMAGVFDDQNFPVWDKDALNDLPSNREWAELANPHLVTIRIATITLTKKKEELLELVDGLETDVVDGKPLIETLVPQFHHTEGFLRALLQTVEAAETRLLAASCKKAVMNNMAGLDD